MKIILDECMPAKLASLLVGHDVKTISRMRWCGISNGALLSKIENVFDVFMTVDKGIKYQQKTTKYNVAIIILKSRDNTLEGLQPLVPLILETLKTVESGMVVNILPD